METTDRRSGAGAVVIRFDWERREGIDEDDEDAAAAADDDDDDDEAAADDDFCVELTCRLCEVITSDPNVTGPGPSPCPSPSPCLDSNKAFSSTLLVSLAIPEKNNPPG